MMDEGNPLKKAFWTVKDIPYWAYILGLAIAFIAGAITGKFF